MKCEGTAFELCGVTEVDQFTRDNNALIIWSGCLEDKNLKVETPVYSLDILPTLSNLFGLNYDSRLLVGRDVFSDTEPLVLWRNTAGKPTRAPTIPGPEPSLRQGVELIMTTMDRIKYHHLNKISFSRSTET